MVPFVARREPRGNGAETYATLTRVRPFVETREWSGNPYMDAPDKERDSTFDGVGRPASFSRAHYDLAFFQHGDAPWASDMEGRPGMGPMVKHVYDLARSGGVLSPAVQDNRNAYVGTGVNPFVDRINLRNPQVGSYGAASDAAYGGEYVYMPGVA